MERAEGRPLKMSDLVKMTGLSRSTIHYYLSEGLLSPPISTGKTMNYYHHGHVQELARIRRLQEEGYPIRMIREMMSGSPAKAAMVLEEQKAQPKRKQKIIDEAVKVFARIGYHQAKVSDIARAAGVGHSTFYLYFPSKQTLFMECLDQVFRAMFSDVLEEIKDEKHPLRRLRVRAEVVLKSHPQFLDILQVLRGPLEDDPRLEAKRREIYALIIEPLKGDVLEAIEQGLLPPTDAEVMSHILLGSLETVMQFMSLDRRYTADDLLDILDQTFFRQGEGSALTKESP